MGFAGGLGVFAFCWWMFVRNGADASLTLGREAIIEGRLEAALQLANRLRMGGSFAHGSLLEAEVLLTEGDATRALECLESLKVDGPLKLHAANLTGRCLLQVGELLEAERAFSYVLSQNPRDVDAHRGLAAVYHDAGSLAESLTLCQKWSELEPRDGRPDRMRGAILKDLKKYPEAISAYTASLEKTLKPQVNQEVRVELADCLVRTGKAEQALEALNFEPASPSPFLLVKADALRNVGKAKEALELIDRARELDPTVSAAWKIGAQIHSDLGRPEEAYGLLKKNEEVFPNDLETQNLLGQICNRLGKLEEAKRHQNRVSELHKKLDELTKLSNDLVANPRSIDAHLRIAEAYENLGMPAMAAQRRHTASLLRRTQAVMDPQGGTKVP